MAARCSAKQISDFVVLWGMIGTVPEYCEYAEDARGLKSLDLIISTLDIFVEAFCFSFEDIYRKYEVNFPLSEEKFMEFLKPRCLLLTKDNKCFNFILVCAFVCDIIHSFSHYNKCFHLVKVASKCLAAILKNRFKKIFETDSDWEELISYCIKIHDLVYPPAKIYESDGNQLVGIVTDKMDASFPNMAQGLAELSAEKYATDDNNNDDSDTKMHCKETSKSLKNDSTTEIEGEKLENSCSLEFPFSTGAPHTLQLTAEGPTLKSENKEKSVDENDASEDNEEEYVANSWMPNLAKEFTNMVREKIAISNNEVTEKLHQLIDFKKNSTPSFEDYLAMKKVTENLEDSCNLGLPSTGATHALQLKVEESSPKEAEDKEKLYDGNDASKDNEDCVTDMTDSSLPELTKDITYIVNEKSATNIHKSDNGNLDQMTGFKKNMVLSSEDYLAMKKVTQRLEDLCNLRLPSTGATHTLQLKVEDLSSKEENKKKICNEKDRKKDEKDCTRDMMDSSLSNLAHDITNITINNKDGDTEKLGQMIGFKKHLTLSFGKDLALKKVPEKIHLGNLGLDSSTGASHIFQIKGDDFSPNIESEHNRLPSTGATHTLQLKVEDLSSKEENKKKLSNENDRKKNEKDCTRDMMDSSLSNLAHDITNITIKNKDRDTEKLGQMIGFKKHLTLSFGKDLALKKVPEKIHLNNLDLDSSTGASHTFQMKGEDFSPNVESEDKEKIVGESSAKDGNKNVTDSLVPDLVHELAKISIEKKVINKNVKDAENPGQKIDCRKKLTLPFSKDSSAQNATKELAGLGNFETASTDLSHTHQLKYTEFSSKKESEDNEEPFNIRCMSADKVRARITENPQQLSEIMNLLKKCEEDIEPNIFSPDEYNIPINDSDEDEGDLEASGGTSENDINSEQNIFESNIKTLVLLQNMKMAHSIKKIFNEDNQTDDKSLPKSSGGEYPHEMSDEEAYVYCNRMFESQDPHCSVCAGGMTNFFDAYIHNFATKCLNNNLATNLLRFDFYVDSE